MFSHFDSVFFVICAIRHLWFILADSFATSQKFSDYSFVSCTIQGNSNVQYLSFLWIPLPFPFHLPRSNLNEQADTGLANIFSDAYTSGTKVASGFEDWESRSWKLQWPESTWNLIRSDLTKRFSVWSCREPKAWSAYFAIVWSSKML